jgi:hypothetical protein
MPAAYQDRWRTIHSSNIIINATHLPPNTSEIFRHNIIQVGFHTQNYLFCTILGGPTRRFGSNPRLYDNVDPRFFDDFDSQNGGFNSLPRRNSQSKDSRAPRSPRPPSAADRQIPVQHRQSMVNLIKLYTLYSPIYSQFPSPRLLHNHPEKHNTRSQK